MSLDCCEYDIIVVDNRNYNKIVKIKDHYIELLKIAEKDIPSFQNMVIINDNSNFYLTSLCDEAKRLDYNKILVASGKKSIINSLFYNNKAEKSIKNMPSLSAIWLKMAAFNFIKGTLAMAKVNPMPIHELSQLRTLMSQLGKQDLEDLELAIECVGLERATRVSINRSKQAMMKLVAPRHDSQIIANKIDYLLDNGILADCYYFVGSMANSSLEHKSEQYVKEYLKLVQIAMGIDNDIVKLENLQISLYKAGKRALKN
jgi:hypothetical protein